MAFNRRYIFLFVFFLCKAQAQLDVGFEYSSYLTHSDLEGQLNHYMDVSFDFKHYDHLDSWFYGAKIISQFSLDESNQNYLSSTDLFVAYELTDVLDGYHFNFTLGRQTRLNDRGKEQSRPYSMEIYPESWSFMDEVWQLGLWEGRANWDYLNPRQKGLTGSFFTVTKDQWLFTLFLSGLFIPDSGPSVSLTKGVVHSGSRWFLPPQSEFILFSQRIEALYWLHKPYLKDVILNDSIAARFRFGSQDKHWFSLAYAYKPVNQIYFKVDGGFSIDKKAVASNIHYQSFKHSLISMDFGMTQNIFKTVLSITQERPLQPNVSKDWIVPVLSKVMFFSSYVELDLQKYYLPIRLLSFNFLYSQFVDSSEEEMEGEEKQLKLDLNVNRFKLSRGFSLSAYSRKFHWKTQSFSVGVAYWYSIPEQGGWLHTSFKWHIGPRLFLESGLDILGVNSAKKGRFFNSYKQNDRVTVKLVYVTDD